MVSPLRRLLPYLFRYRRQYVLGLASVAATSAIQLLSPWILKHAIDDLTAEVTAGKLRFYALALVGVALVGAAFRFLMRRIVIGASREIEYDLRNDFFAHLQRLPLAYFQQNRTGDLMSRATNDLNAVRTMVGPAVMYSATTVIILVAAISLMLSIDARLTLVALVPLPFVSVAVKYFGSAIHRRFEQIQAQLSDLSAVVQENLAGVRVVRAYCQEGAENERFRRANEEYRQRNRLLIRLQGFFYPSLSLFLGLAALLVLWLGARDVIRHRITIGGFVAFNAYLAMLSWPMIAFGWVTNMLQRGTASWKRMLAVMDTVPAVADAAGQPSWGGPGAGFAGASPAAADTPAPAIRGAIEFRHLTFAYDGRPVLDGVDLCIGPGETVAIVGATGSGKSTLISLLPRLHEPPPGTVFVDGVDVRHIPLPVLRGAIGFVPQEPFLFSDTVAENIAFGAREEAGAAPGGLRGAVERAAAIARLDKDVASFPSGFDTQVGERGITLSGGQKQRLCLARALLKPSPVLLLDDTLSAVDAETERRILENLREEAVRRTLVVVSHRVSAVKDLALVLCLREGRVIQAGTHEELAAVPGFYREMIELQEMEAE
jgi:ATP-binding cassette subfamily B multidrug efflux pump